MNSISLFSTFQLLIFIVKITFCSDIITKKYSIFVKKKQHSSEGYTHGHQTRSVFQTSDWFVTFQRAVMISPIFTPLFSREIDDAKQYNFRNHIIWGNSKQYNNRTHFYYLNFDCDPVLHLIGAIRKWKWSKNGILTKFYCLDLAMT